MFGPIHSPPFRHFCRQTAEQIDMKQVRRCTQHTWVFQISRKEWPASFYSIWIISKEGNVLYSSENQCSRFFDNLLLKRFICDDCLLVALLFLMLSSPSAKNTLHMESQNHLGWKEPLRSLSPTVNLTLPSPPLNIWYIHIIGYIHMCYMLIMCSMLQINGLA